MNSRLKYSYILQAGSVLLMILSVVVFYAAYRIGSYFNMGLNFLVFLFNLRMFFIQAGFRKEIRENLQ